MMDAVSSENGNWQAWKRRILIGFFVFSVALRAILPFVSKGSLSYAVFKYFVIVALSSLSLFWCIADGGFSGLRMQRLLILMIILVPYVGVPIYVFQRKGLKLGALMMGRILVFVLFLLVIFGATNISVATALSN